VICYKQRKKANVSTMELIGEVKEKCNLSRWHDWYRRHFGESRRFNDGKGALSVEQFVHMPSYQEMLTKK
jgi:hypothetical protein